MNDFTLSLEIHVWLLKHDSWFRDFSSVIFYCTGWIYEVELNWWWWCVCVAQGWTKFYEFSLSDLRAGFEIIDRLFEGVCWSCVYQGVLIFAHVRSHCRVFLVFQVGRCSSGNSCTVSWKTPSMEAASITCVTCGSFARTYSSSLTPNSSRSRTHTLVSRKHTLSRLRYTCPTPAA